MLKSSVRQLALAGALGAMAAGMASAGVVDFEDVVAPAVFVPGESFSSGGMTFTMSGADFGVVESAAAFLFGNAPLGSTGNFYAGLNDFGLVTMTGGYLGQFRIFGFDFGFVAPAPGSGFPGFGFGQLKATAIDALGNSITEAWDFGNADDNGDFSMLHVGPGNLGALDVKLQQVTFSACLYDGLGDCTRPRATWDSSRWITSMSQCPNRRRWLVAMAGPRPVGCRTRRRRSV